MKSPNGRLRHLELWFYYGDSEKPLRVSRQKFKDNYANWNVQNNLNGKEEKRKVRKPIRRSAYGRT